MEGRLLPDHHDYQPTIELQPRAFWQVPEIEGVQQSGYNLPNLFQGTYYSPYDLAYNTPEFRDTCGECHGVGGTITGEMQGDGHMTGYIEMLEPCGTCLAQELCPGCMFPLWLSFDLSGLDEYLYASAMASIPNSWFVCLVCGWDQDRATELQEASYDYDDDYDGDEGPAGSGGFY